jgi:hypothetical protein
MIELGLGETLVHVLNTVAGNHHGVGGALELLHEVALSSTEAR